MKKLILITLPLLVLLIAITAIKSPSAPAASTLKEGDIVFQTSKSSQSKYIKLATQSPWTHCGIIIERPDGLYVLEAISTVSLTSYGQWVARGKDERVGVKRYSDDSIKIKYFKYLGKPYDTAFKIDNGKWYCSELVYDIYKRQFGVELCKPRPVSDYAISSMGKVLTQRCINKSQLVVAPSDIYESKRLLTIKTGNPIF